MFRSRWVRFTFGHISARPSERWVRFAYLVPMEQNGANRSILEQIGASGAFDPPAPVGSFCQRAFRSTVSLARVSNRRHMGKTHVLQKRRQVPLPIGAGVARHERAARNIFDAPPLAER